MDYAFVVPYDNKRAKAKRVLIGKTLESLKKSCSKLLGINIITIYDENGQEIGNIKEINTGKNIFASQNESLSLFVNIDNTSETIIEEPEEIESDSPISFHSESSFIEDIRVAEEEIKMILKNNILKMLGDSNSYSLVLNQTIDSLLDENSFKYLLVGPKKSGKTIILQEIAKKYYFKILDEGNNRSTVVFFWNNCIIGKNLRDLFRNMISTVFSQIGYQLLTFTPYTQSLILYFQSLYDNKHVPILPKKFSHDENFIRISKKLTLVAKEMNEALVKQEYDYSKLLRIPVIIANVFGFERISFFIDDFEAIESGWGKETGLLEIQKYIIRKYDYVIVGMDQNVIHEALDKTENKGTDLRFITKTIHSFNIETLDDSTCFKLLLVGENTKIITANDCGGCITYNEYWKKITTNVKKLESKGNEHEKDKIKKILLDQLRELIPQIKTDIKSKKDILGFEIIQLN